MARGRKEQIIVQRHSATGLESRRISPMAQASPANRVGNDLAVDLPKICRKISKKPAKQPLADESSGAMWFGNGRPVTGVKGANRREASGTSGSRRFSQVNRFHTSICSTYSVYLVVAPHEACQVSEGWILLGNPPSFQRACVPDVK